MIPEEVEEAEVTELDGQEAVNRAFVASGEKKLGDLVLQPYTPSRVFAAQNMGLRYGYVDSVGLDRFRESYLYPGAQRDVAIVMWLCGKANKDEIYAAGVNGRQAMEKAEQFAEEQKLLDVTTEEFKAAYEMFFDIIGEVRASQFSTEKKTTSSDQG
jgi:hypothetical protein